MNRTLLVLLLCFLSIIANSQEDWLLKAQKMYELGKIEKIEVYIKPFLLNANKEEQISAYRLLILSSIYEKKIEKADSLMSSLLNLENEYSLQNSDSIGEFADLYNSYKTSAKYGLAISGGLVIPSFVEIESHGTYNLLEDDDSYSSNSISFNLGLSLFYFINKNYSLEFGLQYLKLNYINDVNLNKIMRIQFAETQNLLSVPISFKAAYTYKKIKPYVQFGGVLNKLFYSSAEVSRSFIDAISPEVTGPKIDITDLRTSLDYNLKLSLGFDYKIKNAMIGFDLAYTYALNNNMKESSRYSNSELIYKYYYINDDFKLNYISLNFRYTYLFYSPKKQNNL